MRPRRLQRNPCRVSARIGPTTSLTSVGRIRTVSGPRGALARKRQHLGPSLRRNPLPVIEARFTDSRATGHGPPKNIATFNTHTEALEPMAGALWTSYDASFPAIWVEAMKKPSRAGGKPAKARPSKALKLKRSSVPKAAAQSQLRDAASLRTGSNSSGMPEYAERFAEDRIDFSVLPDLSDQDLKDLGIVLGDRRKILRAIGELGGTPAKAKQSTHHP